MSKRRRRHDRRTEMREDGHWPRPPKKTVIGKRKHRRKVNTEVHDAIWSLGRNDRTARLSDDEFNGQVASEIGYMFRLSGSHFKNACNALKNLWNALF